MRTHGLSNKHPLYYTWKGMRQRCNDPNSRSYPNYGGKGIRVCERWSGRDGFLHFIEDMGPKPTPSHTLDRVDNDSNYEPSNCRWATRLEQSRNRRRRYHITPEGHEGHQLGGRNAVHKLINQYKSLSPEERSAQVKKGWETRRAKSLD